MAGFPPRAFFAAAAVVVAILPASASAAAPQVHETWVENVKSTTVVLHALLDGGGLSTTYRFEYIAESAYLANELAGKEVFLGAAKVEGPAGKGSDSPVSGEATSLQLETTYRYRVVAKNEDGTTFGPERILTTRGLSGPLVLLDNRRWEMVSPVDKNGGEIQGPGAVSGGGVFQAASQGGTVTFSSAASFAAGAEGAPAASQYVSRRGAGGWVVENVTAPLSAGGYGEEPEGVPYQLFSAGLSRGLLLAPGHPPLPGTDAPPGYRNYYLRDAAGSYTALLTYADIAGLTVPSQSFELNFAGASPDLGSVVLSTCAALTADATEVPAGEGCDPEEPNLYKRSTVRWRLLNVLPGDSVGTPPAQLAATSGAVSNDGSRVYWTDGTDLYLSEEGAETVRVDADAGGGGTFQTASADGSVAFFTRAGSLYRYSVATDATTNLTPGGDVVGVLGASANGSSVYFLTTARLFLNRGGGNTEVAMAADSSNFPPSTGTARVSADGSSFAFISSSKALSELTAKYDNTETLSGEPVSEVYLYDADVAKLSCISCNPTGERPIGPSAIPGAYANGQGKSATRAYRPRALSTDGNRLFFDSRDALVSGDSNKDWDVYEWEANGSGSCARPGGCLQLISAGSSHGSSFVDASAGGEDVFFLTDNPLVKSDPGSADLYDAREGGGFPQPLEPFVCEEDSCQPLPSPPDDRAPGTLVPHAGNHPVRFPKKSGKAKLRHRKHRGRHRPRKGQRHRNAGGGARRGARG